MERMSKTKESLALLSITGLCAAISVLAQPTPTTPFVIYGYVFYEDGSECKNPMINVTNLNSGAEWQAETNECSNYYQLVLVNGTDLNASEILQFDVKSHDESQLNITSHKVTLEEINNGGIFNFNVMLEIPEAPTALTFDTGTPANPYPSISGTHNGTITPYVTIYNISKLYTYPCPGTGGHTEYVAFYYDPNRTEKITEGQWEGYNGDWHNVSFSPFTMYADHTYYYTIKTGSYPQIHHAPVVEAKGGMGIINCTSFVDANGRSYTNWIPAIRLEGEKVNLVTVETDKKVYEQGESVNITVRNGLNYGIVLWAGSGCEGTVFFVQKFDNNTWTTLATQCGSCMRIISDSVGPMSSKMYDWDQKVYTVFTPTHWCECDSAQQVSEGTYRIKIIYRYYGGKKGPIYDEAYSDDFTIVAGRGNSTSINNNDTPGNASEYQILLKSRQLVPEPGIDPGLESELWGMADAGVERAHVIVQFYDIPNTSERAVLYKDFGVELQAYIPNNTWFAAIPCGLISDIVALPNVRWVGKILPDDKIAPRIRLYGVGSWAVNPDGTVNLLVTFFDDVSNDEATQVIEKYGIVVAEPSPWGGNVWTITMNESDITAFASEDAVKWIQEVAPPPTVYNNGSRAAVGANMAQAPPYNLKGAGVVIAEWDGGWADWNHNDLAGRVTVGDTGSYIDYHATHVAGTAMGNGTNSAGLLRGMAPEANLVTYEWPYSINELDSETNDAIVNYSAVISTNSWGRYIGSNCDLYGDYDDWSQNYDWIVDGKLGNPITIVFAAGNEENNPWCQGSYPYPHPWGRIPAFAQTAKNTIVVGATYSDTNEHTCFSSRGPTDDGRIKPDVSAPGDEANDNPDEPCGYGDMIRSTIPGNEYDEMAGTSMAAPAVSGCVALIYQDYRSTHSGANPTPATIKALLIHTAEDLGNAGPDYTYGWGLINVTAAADVVRADNNPYQTIFEEVISHGQVDTYDVSVPAGSELRATLVWTDEKGEPGAAKELVNDLDITITNDGTTYYPWLLDPDNPGSPATTGVDSINNVEQVVTDVSTGGVYTITVTGTSVPNGPQPYSLIISKGIPTPPPPSADILIVDDDQGANYETYYKKALDANGYNYSYCSSPPDATVLLNYSVVIWLTGDDFEDTLTSTDQANLQTYLNNGGNLFISGQDIGYDIGGSSFYHDYLHANYVRDDTDIYNLNGVTGDPIGDGLTIGISGGDGADNQEYQSEIASRDGTASTVFNYAGDGCGAIKADTGTYKVVYFAFGFEAINNAADRNTVMDRVMGWLMPYIYVPDDYARIQWAVDNASAGDTIIVRDGTYDENVKVNKSLTIKSENGSEKCIVKAAYSGDHVFDVTADGVSISGFTTAGATAGSRKAGIHLDHASYCNIAYNNASDNRFGILLDSSNNNKIMGNTANSNVCWGGAPGIYLDNSHNNTVINNNASNNRYEGICLCGSCYNTVVNNTAIGNKEGFMIYFGSRNNTFRDNTATKNRNNGIIEWSQTGAPSTWCRNNTFINNTVKDNLDGIWLYCASNNTLINNTAENNDHGIAIDTSSNNNVVTGNTVINNDKGIYVYSSSNNLIYNNYLANTNNAYDTGNNVWNTTKKAGENIVGGPYLGGNYWSDYAGEDLDSDGFGDTLLPYNSSGNITNGGDWLPLVSTGGPLWTRYSSRIDNETQCLGVGGIAVDSEDNVIIASNRDVIKYDSSGNVLWEYDLCGCGVAVDKTDNSIVVGLCNSSIIKFSKTGSILWIEELQEELWLSSVKSVPEGDILVSGFGRVDGVFKSYFEIRDKNGNFIGSTTRPHNGWWPSAVFAEPGYTYLAYDLAQGVAVEKVTDDFSSTLWTTTLSNCSQYVSAMGVDSENNLFVRGTTGAGGVGYNQYTAKIDGANGDLIWERIYDSGYQDFGGGLIINPAGDVLVVGTTDYETGGKDKAGILIIKHSGYDGTELKQVLYRKSINDERFEVACGIARDSNGNIYIGGKEYDISDGEGCGIETRRALTMKYSSL